MCRNCVHVFACVAINTVGGGVDLRLCTYVFPKSCMKLLDVYMRIVHICMCVQSISNGSSAS